MSTPELDAIADDWLRWALKGFDGFCGRIDNHVGLRKLTEDERTMLEHIVRRLQDTIAKDNRQ